MTWPRIRSGTWQTTSVVLAGGAALSLGLVTIIGLLLLRAHVEAVRQTDRTAQHMAQAVARTVARDLLAYDRSLRGVLRQAQSPAVAALPPETRHALLFAGAPHDNGRFGFINVLDEQGAVVADSASLKPRPGRFPGRDYFLAQRRNTADTLFIGEPFDKRHGTPTLIPLSRRRSRADGSFAGVVVGSVRLDYLRRLMDLWPVGPHGTVTLLRRDGMILQRIPPAPNEIGHVPERIPFGGLVRRAPTAGKDPVDGLVRQVALQPVPDLPLLVAVGLAAEASAPGWPAAAGLTLAAAGAIGVLNIGLLLWLHGTLRRKDIDAAALRRQAVQIIQSGAEQAAALADVEREQQRQGERLAEVSHDLRAPLQSILGYTQLMQQNGDVPPDSARHLAVIRTEVTHMRDVADHLLARFRKAGGDQAQPEPVDVRAVVQQICLSAQVLAEAKGLTLRCVTDAALPARVCSDAGCLHAILRNLIDNAIKSTSRGGIDLHVAYAEQKLQLAVVDSGAGMPADQAQRLLQPESWSSEPDTACAGLGLTIIRQRTRALGGSIGYKPNPTGGSIVTVQLPAQPVTTITPPAAAGMPPTDRRLLVVEDCDNNREPMTELLRSAGYRVTEANSAEAGLRLAEQAAFDVILTDMQMGGMDGLDLARRIRGLGGAGAPTPIVAVTALQPRHEWSAWQAAGISFYLAKPATLADLIRTIETAMLGSARAEQPAA